MRPNENPAGYTEGDASALLYRAARDLVAEGVGGATDPDDLLGTFFQVARLAPDRPAVVHNGQTLTYGELAGLVRTVAFRLGFNCGTVAVLATRSAETVIALLGVLAAHGTYCPIDPTFPIDRQNTIVRSSGCDKLISTRPGLLIPEVVRVIHLPLVDCGLSIPNQSVPAVAIEPTMPAYALFTSGSTGEPKAVIVPRGAITIAVRSLREFLGITPSDRVLQFAALNWDTCFEEIFPALTAGATLVIDDEAYSGSFPRLLRMVAARQITVMDLPTAYWHELVGYLVEEHTHLPECIRIVIIGGEAARPARLAEWCSLGTERARLINSYGCTETALITHAADLNGPFADLPALPWIDAASVPMGRCMPHVVEYIDEAGELYIGGPSLALGYRDLPEATAERFVTLNVGSGEQRYFRTGDRVAQDASGSLVHQGRFDNQIKVRGVRIEPGEVEAVIAKHPSVIAVAVTGELRSGRMALIAYVVVKTSIDGKIVSTEILKYLRLQAPSHLVPAHLVVVPQLVYTASGKVDRKRSHQRYGVLFNSREDVNER